MLSDTCLLTPIKTHMLLVTLHRLTFADRSVSAWSVVLGRPRDVRAVLPAGCRALVAGHEKIS